MVERLGTEPLQSQPGCGVRLWGNTNPRHTENHNGRNQKLAKGSKDVDEQPRLQVGANGHDIAKTD
jgi:hypothetical protein